MGRIIAFKAPAYYSVSRSNSFESESNSCEIISAPRYLPPASPELFVRLSQGKSKSVSFSDSPPDVCEVPDWDRSPAMPDREEIANAGESDSDEESSVRSHRPSGVSSLEQATRWVRRLAV